jgi:NAD(P)-dependent dehydrogenase (short-subunit alcohol dehydrogenase family)
VFRLDGKVAVITGGASGIGAATAALMASLGAQVVIADKAQDKALERVAEIETAGGSAVAIETDVRIEESVRNVIDTAAAEFGRLDILFNNAADLEIIGGDLDIANVTVENWDASLRADLTGAMFGCKHAIPVMIAAGGGSIINTASVSGIGAEVYMTGYPVAKAAVVHLSHQVALQYGKQGIRCNAIAPGLTLSPAGLAMPKEMRDMYVRHNMLSWVGGPEHIAPTVAFLASDMSAYITGQCIQVDGGITGAIPIAADYRDFVTVGESPFEGG